MTTTAVATASRASPPVRTAVRTYRPWWPWLATLIAFPLAGLAGRAVGGRIDDVGSALTAGLPAGAVLGVGQWLLLRRRQVSFGWIPATAIGVAVGLASGAAIVSYRTDRPSLAIMGAVTGLAVGLLQTVSLHAPAVRSAAWALATAGLWAAGWTVSGGIGFDVAEQWPVFGVSGALAVTVVQCLFIERFLPPRFTPSGAEQS